MKIYHKLAVLLVLVVFSSCKNDDDGPDSIPVRDRGEVALEDDAELIEFLQTHYYFFDEDEQPDLDEDNYNEIRFGLIEGANAGRTPIYDLSELRTKVVTDSDVDHNLYYLMLNEGAGDSYTFADSTLVTYEGRLLDDSRFDHADLPIWFDLTAVVRGFNQALVEFKTAESFVVNPDGTSDFNNFGVGAVFMPSGLGYFSSVRPNIPVYSPLIFTFGVYEENQTDHDGDGIPSYLEDLNDNQNPFDDDTDGDIFPNYADADDDNDGTPTRDEVEFDNEGNLIMPFPDGDGDGTPDHLDEDTSADSN